MKKYSLMILILLLAVGTLWAQDDPPFMHEGGRHGKLAELEKIKLIEALEMDEETTLRFFSRRTEHMKDQKKLVEQRKEMLLDFEEKMKSEEKITEEEFEVYFDKLIASEVKMLENKLEFYGLLDDEGVLTKEQLAKLTVFEFTFMREIRKIMRKERRREESE
jgi:hypothetical protein